MSRLCNEVHELLRLMVTAVLRTVDLHKKLYEIGETIEAESYRKG